ncbi:hypothetical protein SAMN05216284_11478 [Micromonospora sediminimaris]|nr:hypothetical protein SAMN05216284_11478 [Micromonospora sediminimaris]
MYAGRPPDAQQPAGWAGWGSSGPCLGYEAAERALDIVHLYGRLIKSCGVGVASVKRGWRVSRPALAGFLLRHPLGPLDAATLVEGEEHTAAVLAAGEAVAVGVVAEIASLTSPLLPSAWASWAAMPQSRPLCSIRGARPGHRPEPGILARQDGQRSGLAVTRAATRRDSQAGDPVARPAAGELGSPQRRSNPCSFRSRFDPTQGIRAGRYEGRGCVAWRPVRPGDCAIDLRFERGTLRG